MQEAKATAESSEKTNPAKDCVPGDMRAWGVRTKKQQGQVLRKGKRRRNCDPVRRRLPVPRDVSTTSENEEAGEAQPEENGWVRKLP